MTSGSDHCGGETSPGGQFLPHSARDRRLGLPRGERDRALTRLLRGDDVISTPQLLGLGYGHAAIRALCRRGEIVRVFRGVFVDGRTRTGAWVQLKAALRAAGPTAFLSHRTAAAARGYRPINTHDIHVSVVASSTPRIPGITVHRTAAPGRGEVTQVGGLRASTPFRILVEIAPHAKRTELDEFITAAERRNALNGMETILSRHARRHGMANLRAALAGHIPSPGHNSGLEDDVWAWYDADPDLPPPDDRNIRLGPFEFDGRWKKGRLILEIDSRTYHQAKADMEKDRVKDVYVQKHGYRIIRVTETRFQYDKAGIRADFLALLATSA